MSIAKAQLFFLNINRIARNCQILRKFKGIANCAEFKELLTINGNAAHHSEGLVNPKVRAKFFGY
jgi:hypothetical protein